MQRCLVRVQMLLEALSPTEQCHLEMLAHGMCADPWSANSARRRGWRRCGWRSSTTRSRWRTGMCVLLNPVTLNLHADAAGGAVDGAAVLPGVAGPRACVCC